MSSQEKTQAAREHLLERAAKLLPGQFEEVLLRAKIPAEYLPGSTASPMERVAAVLRYMQQQECLDKLAELVETVSGARGKPDRKLGASRRRSLLTLLVIVATSVAVWFTFELRRWRESSAGVLTIAAAGTTSSPADLTANETVRAPSGSDTSVRPGSAAATDSRSGLIDMVIEATAKGATVTVVGTGQSGPAPFVAKLEAGKVYRVRVSAKGFAVLELDVKGGDDRSLFKLVPEPAGKSISGNPPAETVTVDHKERGWKATSEIDPTPVQAHPPAVSRTIDSPPAVPRIVDPRTIDDLLRKLATATTPCDRVVTLAQWCFEQGLMNTECSQLYAPVSQLSVPNSTTMNKLPGPTFANFCVGTCNMSRDGLAWLILKSSIERQLCQSHPSDEKK